MFVSTAHTAFSDGRQGNAIAASRTALPYLLVGIGLILQIDQNVSVHLMITVQKHANILNNFNHLP
jgi:hypothetical protein